MLDLVLIDVFVCGKGVLHTFVYMLTPSKGHYIITFIS